MTLLKRVFLSGTLMLLLLAGVVAFAQGPLAPPGIPGEVVYIPFSVSITLDGDLSDWAGVPTVTVDKGPTTSSNPADNGSFTFAVAADLENIYVMMTTPDQHIIAGQHGQNFWNEDSMEFYLNLTDDLAASGYREGIFQINLNAADIGNTDPAAVTVTGVNGSSAGVEAFVFATEDGWGFEAQSPLPFEPVHGRVIGFQAQLNGASSRNRDVKLIWSNADTSDRSWQNPAVFGRGIFFEVGRTDVPQPSTAEAVAAGPASVDWHALVAATWEGYKNNYIFCGADCGDDLGLVFDPNIEYQAVSEGVGYGLLMAVMMDDQPTFNTIYDATHALLLDANTGLFNWRIDNQGEITGYSSATDAEEDIALALIFAQQRVDNGEWVQHDARPYGERAGELIDAIYEYEVYDGQYLMPGDAWEGNGQEIANLSYFAPAWYRIFDAFQGTDRWEPVIETGYQTLVSTRGASNGLAPDWSTSDGEPAYDFCDRENIAREQCRYEMTYDAIRVPWRIGLDCLWFETAAACDWSARTAGFLNGLPDDQFAQMYDMDGQSVVGYQNELMTGMWLVATMAAGDADLQTRLTDQLYGQAYNALNEGYWGNTPQYYFNQSLAWFGASLLSGDFQNLYEMP